MNANEAFLLVREASISLWVALIADGARPPFDGTISTWISLDRKREEQIRLVKAHQCPTVRTADRKLQRTMNQLMKSIEGLVWLYARRLSRYALRALLEIEDLVQEGFLGVMRAVETFDTERGHAFNTYAHFWIYRGMRKALQNGGVIRLPSSAKPDAVKRLQRSAYLEDTTLSAEAARMSTPGADSNTQANPLAMCIADEDDLADVKLENFQDDQFLVELLAKLNESDPRKFDILVSRFYGERTLAEIGAEYGISREWARRINDEAIKDLQEFAKGRS